MKMQQEKKSVEHLKRELEHLEELKRLNSARATLQVYDEGEFYPEHKLNP